MNANIRRSRSHRRTAAVQASTVSIGNLVDPKSRVKPEDLLAIRELSDMHAFIDCKESEVQAGETLFQESLSHLDTSSSYHRIRW